MIHLSLYLNDLILVSGPSPGSSSLSPSFIASSCLASAHQFLGLDICHLAWSESPDTHWTSYWTPSLTSPSCTKMPGGVSSRRWWTSTWNLNITAWPCWTSLFPTTHCMFSVNSEQRSQLWNNTLNVDRQIVNKYMNGNLFCNFFVCFSRGWVQIVWNFF